MLLAIPPQSRARSRDAFELPESVLWSSPDCLPSRASVVHSWLVFYLLSAGLSNAAVVGIVLGCIAVVVAIIAAIVFWRRR